MTYMHSLMKPILMRPAFALTASTAFICLMTGMTWAGGGDPCEDPTLNETERRLYGCEEDMMPDPDKTLENMARDLIPNTVPEQQAGQQREGETGRLPKDWRTETEADRANAKTANDTEVSESPYGEGRVHEVEVGEPVARTRIIDEDKQEKLSKPRIRQSEPEIDEMSIATASDTNVTPEPIACSDWITGHLDHHGYSESASQLNNYSISEKPVPSWLLLEEFRSTTNIPLRVTERFIDRIRAEKISKFSVGNMHSDRTQKTACDWMAGLLRYLSGQGHHAGRWLHLDIQDTDTDPEWLYPVMVRKGSLKRGFARLVRDHDLAIGMWGFGRPDNEEDLEVIRSLIVLAPADKPFEAFGDITQTRMRINLADSTVDIYPGGGALEPILQSPPDNYIN